MGRSLMRVTEGQGIEAELPKKGCTTEAEPTASAEESGQARGSSKRRWRGRQSVRALRREALNDHAPWADSDQRANEATRLPDGEQVHLGGLVLAEAFTPSTVSALRKALEDLPASSNQDKEERIARLAKGRSAAGAGGWVSMSVVRSTSNSLLGQSEPALPDGVDAVWLYLFFRRLP